MSTSAGLTSTFMPFSPHSHYGRACQTTRLVWCSEDSVRLTPRIHEFVAKPLYLEAGDLGLSILCLSLRFLPVTLVFAPKRNGWVSRQRSLVLMSLYRPVLS